jgi:hypothetical protein
MLPTIQLRILCPPIPYFENVKIKLYKTSGLGLPVVLYECETWSVAIRKGYPIKVSENGVRTFEPKGSK